MKLAGCSIRAPRFFARHDLSFYCQTGAWNFNTAVHKGVEKAEKLRN
jgi:hypothetical protein